MYIQLMHRHYGLHKPIKHIEIACKFDEIYLGDNNINEDLLLKLIPENWLPTKVSNILLTVVDDNGISIGQSDLNKFRPWAKYFDSYCLELIKTPLDWWNEQD